MHSKITEDRGYKIVAMGHYLPVFWLRRGRLWGRQRRHVAYSKVRAVIKSLSTSSAWPGKDSRISKPILWVIYMFSLYHV